MNGELGEFFVATLDWSMPPHGSDLVCDKSAVNLSLSGRRFFPCLARVKFLRLSFVLHWGLMNGER